MEVNPQHGPEQDNPDDGSAELLDADGSQADAHDRPGLLNEDRHTWFLPFTHCGTISYREAVLVMTKLTVAYWHFWDPRCSLRLVTAWNDGRLRVGFEATAEDSGSARQMLDWLGIAARAIHPRLGVGQPTDERPWPQPGKSHTTFTAEQTSHPLVVSSMSLPWCETCAYEGSWQLVIDILTPSSPFASTPGVSTSPPAGHRDRDPEGSNSGEADSPGGALARVTLHGQGASGEVIAALIAADTAADGRLNPRRCLTQDTPPVDTIIHSSLLGHLLAMPARVGRHLPAHQPTTPDDLFTRIDAAPTPHVLLVGASGQGKSTRMGHFGARALAANQTVVAVDVHDGDLLRRQYAAARAAGRPALYIDCSPGTGPQPVMRLADTPPGVSPEQHIETLWNMLRNDWWAALPEEHFGAVGEKVVRHALTIAVMDPAREFGLSHLPRLIDPAQVDFRDDVLGRLANAEITRGVRCDIMPMVTSRDPGNSSVWITSKTAPLSTPIVRGILEGTTNRVPLEEALARGWSIFLHAPASVFGEDAARLIVAVFLHRLWAAVRRDVPATAVTLLLDEWQKYASGLTGSLLAEGRKFGLRLIMANQNLAQLDPRLRESVLSNTGALACFRLGPVDAALVDGLFPTISVPTLQTLRPHNIALTTFDQDIVALGPPPLPEPDDQQPSWTQQLEEFWGGPEPEPHPSGHPALVPDEQPETADDGAAALGDC
jgi:hypothetical protein